VVRVVAPCSPFDRARFAAGVEVLTGLGLVPAVAERVYQVDGFLAGPDSLRAAELVEALCGDGADLLMAARGGYGSMRVLDEVCRHSPAFEPRALFGFSDVTAVHLLLLRAGLVSFHGPNVTTLPQLDAASLARTGAALSGRDAEATFTYAGLAPVRCGRAEGTLVAGNLSMLSAMWGTPWAAPLAGAILVVEDTGEAPYRVDRMLTQLRMQAEAHRLAGVAFGDLGATREEDAAAVRRSIDLLASLLPCPVVTGFPAGHGATNFPVPCGVRASLDADAGLLRVLEDPFA
jgi:muramoyltetrapeptide carboxypeptidase